MSLIFPRGFVLRSHVGDTIAWWGPADELRRARVVAVHDGGERLTVELYRGGVGTIDIVAAPEKKP